MYKCTIDSLYYTKLKSFYLVFGINGVIFSNIYIFYCYECNVTKARSGSGKVS